MDLAIRRDVAAQILHNALFAQNIKYDFNNQGIITQISNTGTTLAGMYYSLDILTGFAERNSIAGFRQTLQTGMNSAFYIHTVDGRTGVAAGEVQFPDDIDIDLLGHEVTIYARQKVAPTTTTVGSYDRIYGTVKKTARSTETPKTAVADVVDGALAGSKTGDNTSLDYYIRTDDGNGLNQAVSDVTRSSQSNARDNTLVQVNYSDVPKSDNKLLAGSPIKFIDNDADGVYEYIIGTSFNYAKVTIVTADDKLTAVKGDGDGFGGARAIGALARADIVVGGTGLKVDDRVILYPIGGKWGAMVIPETKGTLTRSTGNGGTAVISDVSYGQTKLISRANDLQDILFADNFNVESSYYFYGGNLLEGPSASNASKQWAIVKNSYFSRTGVDSYTKTVSLLLADGTSGSYELGTFRYWNGSAWVTDDAINGTGVDSNIEVVAASGAETLDPATAFIALVAISADGKSVDMDDPNVLETDSTVTIGKSSGSTNFSTVAGNLAADDRITGDSVFFTVKVTGSDYTYGIYKGTALPELTTGSEGILTGMRLARVGSYGATISDVKTIDAMMIKGANVPVNQTYSGSFAYITGDPYVQRVGSTSDFFATIPLFDGTETKDYPVADTVRASNTDGNPWNSKMIDSVTKGLTGGSGTNLGLEKGDIIEYAVVNGKISSIVKVPKKENLPSMAGYAVEGYYAKDTGSFILMSDKKYLAVRETMYTVSRSDLVVHEISPANGNVNHGGNLISSGMRAAYHTFAVVNGDGNIKAMFVLTDDETKDIQEAIDIADADAKAAIDATNIAKLYADKSANTPGSAAISATPITYTHVGTYSVEDQISVKLTSVVVNSGSATVNTGLALPLEVSDAVVLEAYAGGSELTGTTVAGDTISVTYEVSIISSLGTDGALGGSGVNEDSAPVVRSATATLTVATPPAP